MLSITVMMQLISSHLFAYSVISVIITCVGKNSLEVLHYMKRLSRRCIYKFAFLNEQTQWYTHK